VEHPQHGVYRRREVDRRDLAAQERLPPDLHRDLKEVLPQQPCPVPDQQPGSRLGRQPALRPRADGVGEVIEARGKARVLSSELIIRGCGNLSSIGSRTSGSGG
jgi:hypothetical protein